jgi:hypothetical protein
VTPPMEPVDLAGHGDDEDAVVHVGGGPEHA